MATKSTKAGGSPRKARFEFRVWGEQTKARNRLKRLASSKSREQVADCYLLVDDPAWNAKVRDNTLKIKHLIAEDDGFERWSRRKHRSAAGAPSPFDELFDKLKLDRPQRGKSYDLAKAISRLDPDEGVRAVFVTKDRRRYEVGDMRAEVTDITIEQTDEVLRTLSIEGDDLDALTELRNLLGLEDVDNTPVHQAIEAPDELAD